MFARRNCRTPGNVLNILAILSTSIAVLAACGGSAPNGQTTAGITPPSTTTRGGKGGGLDIGTQLAAGGALFFQDKPAKGEATVTGLIVITPTGTNGAAPPADTVATLNGVTLARTVVGTNTYFVVDPAGPQPNIDDGFLHITASSVSDDSTRTLNLACPHAFTVSLTPAAGSSLAGAPSVGLSWASGSLPVQGRDLTAFGLAPPSAALFGFEAGTNTMSPLGSPQSLAADAAGATVAVLQTATSGYLVELRYPGVYFIDGQTGGACGLARRFAYVK